VIGTGATSGESSSNDTWQQPGSGEYQDDARAHEHCDVHYQPVTTLATRDHEGPEGMHQVREWIGPRDHAQRG
jgi:hypothetical protein